MADSRPPPPEDLTAILASFFARGDGAMAQFSESQVQQISDLLSYVDRSWSRVPRIYIALRISDQLHHLDTFISLGFTDHLFPVTTEAALPNCLSRAARADFMRAQSAISTRAFDLEEGGKGKHKIYTQGEPSSLESGAIPESGRVGQVDKVVSLVNAREYATKRIHRDEQAQMSLNNYADELEVLKRLRHRHIYTDPILPSSLIMPTVTDCNLSEFLVLASTSPDEKSLLRSFFGCLANAIAYLHRSDIRHEDIRSRNILVKGDNILVAGFEPFPSSTVAMHSTAEDINPYSLKYQASEYAEYERLADIRSLGFVFLEIATIIKGKTIGEMTATLTTNGSRGRYFYGTPDATSQWILTLRAAGLQSDNEPLIWISRMLHIYCYDRPSAATLFETITKSGPGSGVDTKFSGTCCTGEGGLLRTLQQGGCNP
ncbi:MAG: hypothetical protein M1839_000936 [Geoglossum umbratile]|nr:MAG: hypothetical protein M1839_000936 [Geoglossum umbratile]